MTGPIPDGAPVSTHTQHDQALNLNTADRGELQQIGCSEQEARALIERRSYRDWSEVERIGGASPDLTRRLQEAGAQIGVAGDRVDRRARLGRQRRLGRGRHRPRLTLQVLDALPTWLQAGIWGLLAAGSLVVGAAVAYVADLGTRLTAAIMSFGCGILISAIAYDLIFEGFRSAGIKPIVIGAVAGSVAYALANWMVHRHGGRHRKRSGGQQMPADQGGGMAIAVGSLLDGIPESIVLGVSLLGGHGVSLPVFAAIFLSNFPEGLSSATGMKKAGRSKRYIFGLWGGIMLISGFAALGGAAFLGGAPPTLIALVEAVAAGALLTMVSDTMIPEAVEGEHGMAGMLVVVGLLLAFALSHAVPG